MYKVVDTKTNKKISLDTNVLIDTPDVVFQKGIDFVIPFKVIQELDNLKRNPDLKFAAQSALRNLEYQESLGKVEVLGMPTELRDTPDEVIINTTKEAGAALHTKDLGARLIARAFGVPIANFEVKEEYDPDYTGIVTIKGTIEYENSMVQLKELPLVEFNHKFNVDLKENQYCIIDRLVDKDDIWWNLNGEVTRISQSLKPFKDAGIMDSPLDSEQMCALHAITTNKVPLTIIDGVYGSGKAQPISEPILTPEGWKTMGDIKAGSKVIGSNGEAVDVISVHPQGERDIYSVIFKDGTEVRCDLEHIWTVYTDDGKPHNLTVAEMLAEDTYLSRQIYDKRYGTYQNKYKYSIPLSSACEFGKDVDYPIAPYALGLLLGDGGLSQNSIQFTNGSKGIVNRLVSLLEPAYTIKPKWKHGAWRGTIIRKEATKSFRFILEELGLFGHKSETKFIPDIYKRGSLETRQAIIQGLIDTDGHVSKDGILDEYSTCSHQLAEDFIEIGRSIGMVLTVKNRIPTHKYKGEMRKGQLNYRIRQHKRPKYKSIVDIKKVGREESQCIYIDSPDHLYVTTGFNLTHNTLLSLMGALSCTKGQKRYKYYDKILVTKPPVSVDKALYTGYKKGTSEDKMSGHLGGIKSNIKYLLEKTDKDKKAQIASEVWEDYFDVIELDEIQGASLHNTILLVDEQQLISNDIMKLVITRIAEGSKLVLIGDTKNQTYGVNRANEGFKRLYTKLGKSPHMSYIRLTKIYRSALAEFANSIYED